MSETSDTKEPQGGEEQSNGGDVVEAAFQQSAMEGVDRLRRDWPSLLATGMVGGIDLGMGVLALLVVEEATGSRLLGALAFSFGFVALVLAKSELFTENFLVPIAAVVAHSGTLLQVFRLWFGTAVTNLIGGWIVMALVIGGVPRLAESGVVGKVGLRFLELGIGWTTFASAVLAGAAMTLMTWMERGNQSVFAKLVAAVGVGFILAGSPLLHSIVSSLEIFAALQVGAQFSYLDWLGMFGWAVLGNAVGGLGLITTLRFVQVGIDTIETQRAQPEG